MRRQVLTNTQKKASVGHTMREIHPIQRYSQKEIMWAKKARLYYTVMLQPFMSCRRRSWGLSLHRKRFVTGVIFFALFTDTHAHTHARGPEPCYINTSCLLNTQLCQPAVCYSDSIFRPSIYILDKINNDLFLEMIFTRRPHHETDRRPEQLSERVAAGMHARGAECSCLNARTYL